MAIETEEKFVMDVNVFNDKYRRYCKAHHTLSQAYITQNCYWDVVVSMDDEGDCYVSIKSRLTSTSIVFPLDLNDYIELSTSDGVKQLGHNEDSYKVDPTLWALRVRIVDDKEAIFCFKERVAGASRKEYEASMPIKSADFIYYSLSKRISKIRHLLDRSGYTWEIDIFLDKNKGLCIAEIETEDLDFPLIDGLREKVTEDRRYYNAELCEKPFTQWKDKTVPNSTQP